MGHGHSQQLIDNRQGVVCSQIAYGVESSVEGLFVGDAAHLISESPYKLGDAAS